MPQLIHRPRCVTVTGTSKAGAYQLLDCRECDWYQLTGTSIGAGTSSGTVSLIGLLVPVTVTLYRGEFFLEFSLMDMLDKAN